MAAIALYKNKVNGVGSLLDDIIKSSNNLNTQLGTLKNTLQGVDSNTCDLQATVDSISSSTKSEKERAKILKSSTESSPSLLSLRQKETPQQKLKLRSRKTTFTQSINT